MPENVPNYPAPVVPLSPVFSLHSAKLRKARGHWPSILDCKFKLYLTSGRAAIALALVHTGVNAGNEILVPAFHCESMVAPVRWLGAKPVFYKINADATYDLEDIAGKISAKTRAIIVTHYFGFLQNMRPLLAYCQPRNIRVIEDCAHAFFGQFEGAAVGSLGDYAVASSMKFFPILDGGLLTSNSLDVSSINLHRTPIPFEIKSLVNSIEKSAHYKRFGLAGKIVESLIFLKDLAWRVIKREDAAVKSPAASSGGQQFEEDWIRCRASYISRKIVSHSNFDRIVRLRRRNFNALNDAFAQLPLCHPFYDTLPGGIVPLVYPLYVHEPTLLFDQLKRLGVPIWRFGEFLDKEVTERVCPNSVKLSAHIFQFPCHQELRDDELTWIIEQVTRAIHAITAEAH